jgi:hypothetical protein
METTAKKSPSGRVKRTPVTERQVLSVKGKEPGYVYRIVNDTGDRIAQFQEMGYELVDDKDVTVGDRRIQQVKAEGTKAQVSVGQGIKAFVMRQKQDWYNEDQEAKQAKVDQLEQSTKNQATSGTYGKLEITQSKA